MGLFDKVRSFFSQKSATKTTLSGDWTVVGGANDGVDERNLLLNNKEWVFIAVDRIASAVTSVPMKVMRYKRSGDDQEVFDGPLVNFLDKPGPGLTGKDFLYLNTVYKELTGNAFWLKDGEKVSPLIPTSVSPRLENDKLTGYKYRAGGQDRVYDLEDVLHDRYIDPSRPFWGVGKLSKIARWVDSSSYANEFLRMFFINGATFGGFITTEEETEARIKMIKAGLANDHVGVANAHKIGVLPKGSDFKQTTAKMSDMEMGATDDRYRDKILSGFGVPKTLVGLTTEVNRATAEASEYVFARYTIKPIVEDLMEFLNEYVAKELDPSGQYYFAYDEFVPVNMEIELKEREIALNRQPYKTVNEVRAEQGLPPVSGGDVVYGPPFQMPLGEPQAAPEPPVSDDEDEDDAIPAKDIKKRSGRLPAHVRTFAAKEERQDDIFSSIAKVFKDAEGDRDLQDEIAHKDFVGRVESYLERVGEQVRVFNSEQQGRVLNNLQRITRDVSRDDIFDLKEEMAVMINFVQPLLRGLMTEQALAEYEAQGFEGVFDTENLRLAKTVEKATKRLAKTYNTTTAKLLKRELNAGISAGDSLSDLTKRVQTVYEFSDKSRAQAVAHTESFYIANEGNKEAYRQSGVVQEMRWYTAEDERVCPWCEPQNGRVVGVNEVFFKKGEQLTAANGQTLKLNYRSIDVPPIHTNCRCFIRPETIEI